MLNEKFSDIQEDYLKAKEVYELSLEKLLNQAPNFSKDTLNNINSNFSKFHTKFEEFLTNISSENYDLSKWNFQKQLDNSLAQMMKHSLKIECNAALFHVDEKFVFNGSYHPNKYGALIRSENLAYCINELIKNSNFSISYKEALELTNKLELKYDGLVKKSNYIKRLEDLNYLKIALENYYKDNGNYPISQGFDGLYTKWGYSGNDWIKGLSPKYVNKLPIDPRNTNNPSFQYLYKSNGKDYKLISHSPEDCKGVEKLNNILIDPLRKCWAYGFWTDGAKDW